MPVRIVTDSAADIDEELAAELGIYVVPLTIRFGADELTDRVDLTPAEFYQRMAASPVLPETAAPAPGAFDAAFRRLFEGGAEAVVCINLSSGLSATMQSAETAAKAFEGQVIRVVDSRSITWGLGSQVVTAARMAADGAKADDIVTKVIEMIPRTRVYGAFDTLENLRKGGRIGGAKALLGSLLAVKPVLDISSGVVEEEAKLRTRRRSLQYLADKVLSHAEVENLAIMHGSAPDVDQLVAMLADRYPIDAIHIDEIGATIGVHGGPRVMGVTFQVAR
jgi:DegV family protein with EDD domain